MTLNTKVEMLQLELYVSDVESTATIFVTLFEMVVIQVKHGWRHLRHAAGYDFMLFDPASNIDGEAHWSWPFHGAGGIGVEIVICTTQVRRRRDAAIALGLDCSDLRFPPWGSTEFLFRLPEGYLLRIKERPEHNGVAAP